MPLAESDIEKIAHRILFHKTNEGGLGEGEHLLSLIVNAPKRTWDYVVGDEDAAHLSHGPAGTLLARADTRAGKAAVRSLERLDADDVRAVIGEVVVGGDAGGLTVTQIADALVEASPELAEAVRQKFRDEPLA